MNSALCIWLAGIEHRFWKMTIGVFVFVCQYLPEWLLRTLLETVGPAVVRMVRLMVALCIWLSVLLSPIVVSIAFGASFWADFGGFLWLVTAISGSIYGLYRVVKKRRAKAAEAIPVPVDPGLQAPVARLLPVS